MAVFRLTLSAHWSDGEFTNFDMDDDDEEQKSIKKEYKRMIVKDVYKKKSIKNESNDREERFTGRSSVAHASVDCITLKNCNN